MRIQNRGQLFRECSPCLGNRLLGRRNILSVTRLLHGNRHSHEWPSGHTNIPPSSLRTSPCRDIPLPLGSQSGDKKGNEEELTQGSLYTKECFASILTTQYYLGPYGVVLSQDPRVDVDGECTTAITTDAFKVRGRLALLCLQGAEGTLRTQGCVASTQAITHLESEEKGYF